MTSPRPSCPLCAGIGGHLVYAAPKFRLVRADEPGFPAFWRVVWNAHAAEFTDLDAADRAQCMDAVAVVEQTVRTQLQPTKMNLAAFGNAVPHLHWHVIARDAADSHFPAPTWGVPVRPRDAAREAALAARIPAAEAALTLALAARFGGAAKGPFAWQA